MIRVLIADDEAPARERLRQILGAHTDVLIAGEAATGPEALAQAQALRPDVILLDIQMPGASGLDVALALRPPRPRIVFCTAYEQHALEAFELAAFDYLLKPISRSRLAKCLERLRDAARDSVPPPARFLVKHGHSLLVLPEEQILYFRSEHSLSRAVCARQSYWLDPSLNDLEARLDPQRFFRAARETLLQLRAVSEVQARPGGMGVALMSNGDRLDVSRRRFRALLAALDGRSLH